MGARRKQKKSLRKVRLIVGGGIGLVAILLLALYVSFRFGAHEFPVTVNPREKTINENSRVNIFLAEEHSLFRAAGIEAEAVLEDIAGGYTVVIKPGMRKEQVAATFGRALGWNTVERRQFMTPLPGAFLPFTEGTFMPGTYHVTAGMTPLEAQAVVNERFTKEVLAHYGTSTQAIVPLKDALIIASIIQRETIGTDGMRLVSGIIWNRIFIDMNLQIDATLQYSKANSGQSATWWPRVASTDKYLSSPYNTYMHAGLPPEPISNPSVAAILAALNPIETPCLFYFNDPTGAFHCSVTYDEHRELLGRYY